MPKRVFYTNTYRIIPPIGKIYYWGAKGIYYEGESKKSTKEVWGKTEEEARRKVEEMINQGGDNLWHGN